jgi:hypothetical protein
MGYNREGWGKPQGLGARRTRRNRPLVPAHRSGNDPLIEQPIDHRDVTTIMALLGDIQADVHVIRRLLEEEDGEEEAPQDDR